MNNFKNTLDLIADLRNKLGPIKNYFVCSRKLDQINAKTNKDFIDGLNLGKLNAILAEEKLKCEENIYKIEMILESLESLEKQ